MSGPPEITLFFGRLHPLLVHLPIGLILLLAVLELLARSPRLRHANANAGLILALTVPVALASALCGWLLSRAGGYQDHLLQWHKWTGIATAGFCLASGLLYGLDLKKAYRWCLWSCVAALIVASHFGGSLTHGSDYLVRYAPQPFRAWFAAAKPSEPAPAKVSDPGQLVAFTGVIQPILKANCVSCHGPDKAKAKLRVDSLEAMLKGGESGPGLIPGKAAESLVLKRIHLAETEDDHMPPTGKTQPSPTDVALLEWWIDQGAPSNKKIAELKPPPNISRILAEKFGGGPAMAKSIPPKPLGEILPLAANLADQLGIVITALSAKDAWLQCNAAVAGSGFTDADLAKLAPLAANLRWLDLAGTKVTDQGLEHFAAPNLVRLHLERTAITDAGLQGLLHLESLEYLDLYGTQVSDTGLRQLEGLPKLKQVFLWQTKVTPAAAAEFAEARTDKDQLLRWQKEIDHLQTQIRDAHVTVDLGTTTTTTSTTNASPANAECPVSGKPVDPTKTLVHDGLLIAFCCDDCKAKFEHDPKPFLEKLAALIPKDSKPKAGP